MAISLDYYQDGIAHSYDLPERTLSPGATSLLDIGAIIASGKPDANGSYFPLGVNFGGYHVRKIGQHIDKTITTEALVFDRRTKTFTTFYNTCCGVSGVPTFTPSLFSGPPGPLGNFLVQCTDYCSGQTIDMTGSSTFSSSNTGVATVSSAGAVSGVAAGFTDSNGSLTYPQQHTVDTCLNKNAYAPTPTNVTPTISQDRSLWFFGLGNTPPSGFNGGITATLTANGAGNGTYVWTITNGTSKAVFENNSSTITKTNVNTVGITSSSYSTQANDVTVQLNFTPSGGSQVTTSYSLSIDSPYKLVSNGTITNQGVAWTGSNSCSTLQSGSNGWVSFIPYRMQSFFGVTIANEYINETFANWADDYVGNNWPLLNPGPPLLSNGTFSDKMCVVFTTGAGTPPSLSPQSPLSTVKIDHNTQDWYVGGQTPGSGVQVQADTFQRFQDHGTHANIQSPVR